MSVSHLDRTMSAAELAEWEAFDSIEPIGDERADLRIGILASLWANLNRRKGAAAFKPSDFMPFIDRAAIEQAEKKSLQSGLRQRLMSLGKATKGG